MQNGSLLVQTHLIIFNGKLFDYITKTETRGYQLVLLVVNDVKFLLIIK